MDDRSGRGGRISPGESELSKIERATQVSIFSETSRLWTIRSVSHFNVFTGNVCHRVSFR